MYLHFSDAAKYADIARNIIKGLPYGSNFSFWTDFALDNSQRVFLQPWVLPAMPYSISFIFKLFGISDFSVIFTSLLFYLATLPFVFFLAKKLFNNYFVGVLSVLAVAFDNNVLNYALSGASESLLILEIAISLYLVTFKKLWTNIALILILILMYFTRPLAFIYISGVILFWILHNLKKDIVLLIFISLLIAGGLFDYFVLKPASGSFHLYSIIGRATGSSLNQSTTSSEILRGVSYIGSFDVIQFGKSVLYNIYNFYKLLPNIINPYFSALFIIYLFIPNKNSLVKNFLSASVYIVILNILVVAASMPFYRYLHPLILLIYIVACGFLVNIFNNITPRTGQIFNLKKVIILISIVAFFGIGQTIGHNILDKRYINNIYNVSKPPVYVALSKILNENTDKDSVVLTNLDTWGSWYGERKTIWYPINLEMLVQNPKNELVDVIFLTSYLIDDSNYYMSAEWREIFLDPNKINNEYIKLNYRLGGIYDIESGDVYENIPARAVLLIKKQ